ncbi:cytochrome P450 [Sphingomonas sp. UYEF23]|uniref:cytochrome P450 n=1 Tax=Sphingomonas sp. UYEF23 TaxID=1756408 RepID=UPI003390A0D1
MTIDLQSFTPDDLFDDPYPIYAALREQSPVHYYEPTGEWLISRWRDCQTVGGQDKVFGPSDAFQPMVKTMGIPNVLTMDGETHKCLRAGIDAQLAPEPVDRYVDGLARPIVRSYLDAIRGRGEGDLTTELFEPISVRCIANVLGLEAVDSPTLARWFHAMNAGAQNVADDPAIWSALDAIKAEIAEAMRPVYERVVSEPDESVTSHVVRGGMPEGQIRSLEEIMPTMHVIILGALQEPGHGAANAMFGLLQNPDQSAMVAADPVGLALKAFDEGLRWIAPIGVTTRRAAREFELNGVVIPERAVVANILSSANRDATRWDDPDSYRIDRQRKGHASFGYRPHFCSGHYLSRNIGRIALEETYRTLHNVTLDQDHSVRTQGWRFRGVVNLPARWEA